MNNIKLNMKRLVILSGAGVSAESGLRTFRDSDGLWENYPVEQVASIDSWPHNKELMIDFYNQRRHDIERAQPNAAHKYIAELEKYYNVTVITQNIDNLHERAGSSHVIHLHGEITKARSEKISSEESFYLPDKVKYIGYSDIKYSDKADDGGQMRPHIVWFGEAVPFLQTAAEYVSQADILIVIGTSLNVYPAAGLVNYTKDGAMIYLIDPKPIHLNLPNFKQFHATATEGMKQLYDMLL